MRQVEEIVYAAVEEGRRLVSAQVAVLGLTVGEGRRGPAIALSPAYAGQRDLALDAVDSPLAAEVRAQRRPIRRTGPEPVGTPGRSWLAVPLPDPEGVPLGVLQVADKVEGEFTSEDEARLIQLAALAAAEIRNARLTERLHEQDERKDEFLGKLAHELRNPLAPLRAALQILRFARSEETAQKAREVMERQLGHMVRLLDDLLDISRVSRGKVEVKRERVTVQAIVDEALEASRAVLEAGGHSLIVRVPQEALILDADQSRLAQVLTNLLNNAARYTPDGGRIMLTVERAAREAVICVADNGIGMPRELVPRIFDLFTQVNPSPDRGQGGLGIELSIVKRLVEMHDGSVSVESAGPGEGSAFTIRLPLAPEPVKVELGADPDTLPPGPAGPVLRVLVVDDNVDGAESVSMLLEVYGHESRTAHSGPEALAVAREYHPDLVFLDIGLPEMNGYEVARAIRNDPSLGRPVLVALTGWGSEAHRERSLAAGFDHHLTKPVEPGDLETLVARVASGQKLGVIPRVLIIAGSDSGGGAGIQADLKTVTALGGYAATAITAITVQNTLGVTGVHPIPAAIIAAQARAVLEDLGADALKLGMLGDVETVEIVARILAEAEAIPAVVDPVMVAKGGSRLLEPRAIEAVRALLVPRAALLTPNAPEAEALTGLPCASTDDLRRAGAALLGMGARAVLMKGGHLAGDRLTDVLMTPDGEALFEGPRIDTRHTHGTGCTLASACAVGLARGLPLAEAVARARAYTLEAIRRAPGFGAGHGPLDHAWPLRV